MKKEQGLNPPMVIFTFRKNKVKKSVCLYTLVNGLMRY